MELSREQIDMLQFSVSAAQARLAALGVAQNTLELNLKTLLVRHIGIAGTDSSYRSILDAGK